MKTLKVGLVGVGKHYIENLIEPISLICDLNLAKLYSRDIEVSKQKSSGLNISCFGNYENLKTDIMDQNIDCVISALPATENLALIKICCEYNFPVFVEKPAFLSSEDLTSLQSSFLASKALVHIGYNYKYDSLYKTFKDKLTTSNITHIDIIFNTNKSGLSVWNLSSLESFLYAQFIHAIDIANDLNLYSKVGDMQKIINTTIDGKIQIVYSFISNGIIYKISGHNFSDKFEFAIRAFEKDKIIFLDDFKILKVFSPRSAGLQNITEYSNLGISKSNLKNSGYYNEILDFLQKVSNGYQGNLNVMIQNELINLDILGLLN